MIRSSRQPSSSPWPSVAFGPPTRNSATASRAVAQSRAQRGIGAQRLQCRRGQCVPGVQCQRHAVHLVHVGRRHDEDCRPRCRRESERHVPSDLSGESSCSIIKLQVVIAANSVREPAPRTAFAACIPLITAARCGPVVPAIDPAAGEKQVVVTGLVGPTSMHQAARTRLDISVRGISVGPPALS